MKHLAGMLAIALALAALHGQSVTHGLMLDDNNHRAELREGGWSWRSLVEASHLGDPRRRVRMWWQENADQHFFRPVAFLLMRAQYVVGGWRPAVMHAFSLAWTLAGATLVMHLGRAAGLGALGAALAGVLFVVHPANVLTTRWIACQNEQMASAFMLAGLLLYARWAGWWRPEPAAAPARTVSLVAAIVCFVVALGCRETAVVFGPILVAGDLLWRPVGRRTRWPVWALVAAVTVSYLAIRHAALGGLAMPGPPYACLPSMPGFGRFVFDKLLYYLLGLFAFLPVVGFAGLRAVQAQPAAFYGAAAILVLLWIVVLAWLPARRTAAFYLIAAAAPLAPVLPVFASGHHLFLASAGAMLAVATVAGTLWRRGGGFAPRRARGARAMLAGAIGLYAAAAAAMAGLTGQTVAGFMAASQLPATEAAALGGPYRPGDRLFFINLPPLGFNCVPAIEEAAGVAPLTGYVLTFTPDILGMDRPGFVQRVGQRQLRVWLDGDGYFSGLMGLSMLEAVGRDRPFAPGEAFATPDFSVRIVRGSRAGIREMLFTFERPLDDPAYHFFFGSPRFSAYPLRFAPSPR